VIIKAEYRGSGLRRPKKVEGGMRECLHKCDICKREVKEQNYKANEWDSIELGYGKYNTRIFDICPECKPTLNIPTDKMGGHSVGDESVADRLFAIIQEIIAENREG
jgi:hypothetical protein